MMPMSVLRIKFTMSSPQTGGTLQRIFFKISSNNKMSYRCYGGRNTACLIQSLQLSKEAIPLIPE